jgi:hypothetical protein
VTSVDFSKMDKYVLIPAVLYRRVYHVVAQHAAAFEHSLEATYVKIRKQKPQNPQKDYEVLAKYIESRRAKSQGSPKPEHALFMASWTEFQVPVS